MRATAIVRLAAGWGGGVCDYMDGGKGGAARRKESTLAWNYLLVFFVLLRFLPCEHASKQASKQSKKYHVYVCVPYRYVGVWWGRGREGGRYGKLLPTTSKTNKQTKYIMHYLPSTYLLAYLLTYLPNTYLL